MFLYFEGLGSPQGSSFKSKVKEKDSSRMHLCPPDVPLAFLFQLERFQDPFPGCGHQTLQPVLTFLVFFILFFSNYQFLKPSVTPQVLWVAWWQVLQWRPLRRVRHSERNRRQLLSLPQTLCGCAQRFMWCWQVEAATQRKHSKTAYEYTKNHHKR